jgi:hypothetical protein
MYKTGGFSYIFYPRTNSNMLGGFLAQLPPQRILIRIRNSKLWIRIWGGLKDHEFSRSLFGSGL